MVELVLFEIQSDILRHCNAEENECLVILCTKPSRQNHSSLTGPDDAPDTRGATNEGIYENSYEREVIQPKGWGQRYLIAESPEIR